MHRRANRAHGETGAAAVELALVLFPLLMLMLGVIEFSRVYSLQLRLQQAAREAAREIALTYDDPGPPTLDVRVDTLLRDLLSDDIVDDLDTTTIVICSATEPDAVVTLIDDIDLAIPLIGGSTIGAVPVAAKAQMACER